MQNNTIKADMAPLILEFFSLAGILKSGHPVDPVGMAVHTSAMAADAAIRNAAGVNVAPRPEMVSLNRLARAVWYGGGGSVFLEDKGRLCICAVRGSAARASHAVACDLLWQAYRQAVPGDVCWDQLPHNLETVSLPLTDAGLGHRLLKAVYHAGGGALYLEDFKRLCFCPARGKGQRHATACDDLWEAYVEAAGAALRLACYVPPGQR